MDTPRSAAELLRGMVAFDTVTPRASGRADAELPLAEWLHAVAESWGLRCEWLPIAAPLQPTDASPGLAPNLLVWPPSNRADTPWLVLDGHLDTVDHAGMTVPPLGDAEPVSGAIRGRGACDAKGAGAAMLWALKAAHEAGNLAGSVAVLLSVGEEDHQVGARSFAEFDAPRLRAQRGWSVAGVVVGEPTQMRAVAATGGFLRWKLTTRGVAAHSSRPEHGRNAIVAMARVVAAMQDEYIDRLTAAHPLAGHAACSVTLIEGGVQHNVVPDRCTVTLDRRLAPGESSDAELAAVAALLEKRKSADPTLEYEQHAIETAPPMAGEANLPLADWCVERLADAGVASAVGGEPYTTNANHYAAAGLPCVVLGPGDIAMAHTKHERLELADLEAGVRGYGAILRGWRGVV